MDLFFPVTALSTPVWNLLSHSINAADQLSLLLLFSCSVMSDSLQPLVSPVFYTSLYHCPSAVPFHTDSELDPPSTQEKLKWRFERVLECFYFLHLDPNHCHENKLRPTCWNTEPGWITPLCEALLDKPAPSQYSAGLYWVGQKKFIGFFHEMLWKNPMEHFGQSRTYLSKPCGHQLSLS